MTGHVPEAKPPKRKKSERRQRTELVALRLLPDERRALEREAEKAGMSMSELIRERCGFWTGIDVQP